MFNNAPSGLSALSAPVSRMREELQKNNVQPGQESDYFQKKGVPLSPEMQYLIQMNQMLQQKAGQPQGNPNPSTVEQDLQAATGGRNSGIAQLPSPNVGETRAFASGGIVAFKTGDEVKSDESADEGSASFLALAAKYGWEGAKKMWNLRNKAAGALWSTGPAMMLGLPEVDLGVATLPGSILRKKPVAPQIENAPGVKPDSSPLVIPGETVSAPEGKIGGPALPPPPLPGMNSGLGSFNTSIRGGAPVKYTPQGIPQAITDSEAFGRKLMDPNYRSKEREESRAGLRALEEAKLSGLDKQSLADEKARRADMWLNLSQALAGVTGQRGSAISKIGSAAGAFGKGAKDIKQQYREKDEKMKEARYKLQEAAALRQAGDFEAADARAREGNKILLEAGVAGQKFGQDERRMQLTADTTNAELANRISVAEAQMRLSKLQYSEQLRLTQMRDQISQMPEGPGKKAAMKQYLDRLELNAKEAEARNSGRYLQAIDQQRIRQLQAELNNPSTMVNPARMAEIQQELASFGGGAGGSGGTIMRFDSQGNPVK